MRKLFTRLLLFLALGGIGYAGWVYRAEVLATVRPWIGQPAEQPPKPDPETYTVLSDSLESHRQRLATAYGQAANEAEKEMILGQARQLLEGALPRLMRCWLGTPWDFNGIAHEPGAGKVACGYFVSSVLQDARFNVEWGPLAQQPSQNILATFLPSRDLTIRQDMEYEAYLAELQRSGPGIYIIGLDSHVAFLVLEPGSDIRFIHSSGADPKCVVDESRDQASVLRKSRYRVSGNITRNDQVVRNWLLGANFKTRRL